MKQRERLTADERRKQIMMVATELFAQKGFSGTRTREIASLAGISETLIFQHFKSKEELYRAILLENLAHHPLQPEIEGYETQNDDYAVFHTTATHIIKNMNNPLLIRLFLYGILESPQLLVFSNQRNQHGIQQHLENYIQKRINDGVFKQTNAALTAQSFIYSVSMFCLEQVLAGKQTDLSDEFITAIVHVYINGLVR